jgi:hypothetical protein
MALALGVTLVIAAPWVAAISHRDGHLTISGAGQYARGSSPVFGEGAKQRLQPLKAPPNGRLYIGEDPVYEFARFSPAPWSPWDGWQGLKFQAITCFRTAAKTLQGLHSLDAFALLLGGLVVTALLALPLRQRLRTADGLLSLWLCATVALYLGGYVFVLIETRYLWALAGLLAAMCVRALGGLGDSLPGLSPGVAPSLRRAAAALLVVSAGISVLVTVDAWRGPSGLGAEGRWFKQAAREMAVKGPFASNLAIEGTSICYWSNETFLGWFRSTASDAVAEELRPFGPVQVLVLDDEALADRLEASPVFRRVGRMPPGAGSHTARLFELSAP